MHLSPYFSSDNIIPNRWALWWINKFKNEPMSWARRLIYSCEYWNQQINECPLIDDGNNMKAGIKLWGLAKNNNNKKQCSCHHQLNPKENHQSDKRVATDRMFFLCLSMFGSLPWKETGRHTHTPYSSSWPPKQQSWLQCSLLPEMHTQTHTFSDLKADGVLRV